MKKIVRNLVIASGVVALGAVILKKTVGSHSNKKIEDEKEEYYDWNQVKTTAKNAKQKKL